MRHLIFSSLVRAMVPRGPAPEICIDGLPWHGARRLESRAMTLREETAAAQLPVAGEGQVLGPNDENQPWDVATWVSLYTAKADKPQLAAHLSPWMSNAAPLGWYDNASVMYSHPLSGSENRRPVTTSPIPNRRRSTGRWCAVPVWRLERWVGAVAHDYGGGGVSRAGRVQLSPEVTTIEGQTIPFPVSESVTLGVLPFVLSAKARSGLPVSFAGSTPAVCAVAGTVLMIVGGRDVQGGAAAGGQCELRSGDGDGDAEFKLTQTIPLAPLAAPGTLVRKASVSFTSLTSANCTLSRNTVAGVQVTAPVQTIPFQTSPPGLRLEVNGLAITGGTLLSLVPGSYPMAAMNLASGDGTRYQLASRTQGAGADDYGGQRAGDLYGRLRDG
ncbi:MAG: hypothetical protein NTX13_18220 [Acidobacteria bacterium]|nr:hypothetical protein [Acidobacteriota bacterium]